MTIHSDRRHFLRRGLVFLGLPFIPCVLPAPAQSTSSPAPSAEDLRTRMTHLVARAKAVLRSLESIEDSLRRSGMTLRSDIQAARENVETYLDRAADDFDNGRLDDCKTDMDKAEAHLKTIESFLGDH